MNRQPLAKFALIFSVLIATSLSARAAVELQFYWEDSHYQMGYQGGGNYGVDPSDAIGIWSFHVTQNPDNVAISNPFYSVCLSPAGDLDRDPHFYNIIPFGGAGGANPGRYPSVWAWNQDPNHPQYWGIQNAAYLWNTYGLTIAKNLDGLGDQNLRATALEFAIWNTLYNSTAYGQINGQAWQTPALDDQTKGYYDSYLYALTHAGSIPLYEGNILRATDLTATGSQQDLFILTTPVPEPSTIIAGALLLVPLAGSMLRREKHRKTNKR